VTVSRKRVARLMREHAIRGFSRRRGFTVTTLRDKGQPGTPRDALTTAALRRVM